MRSRLVRVLLPQATERRHGRGARVGRQGRAFSAAGPRGRRRRQGGGRQGGGERGGRGLQRGGEGRGQEAQAQAQHAGRPLQAPPTAAPPPLQPPRSARAPAASPHDGRAPASFPRACLFASWLAGGSRAAPRPRCPAAWCGLTWAVCCCLLSVRCLACSRLVWSRLVRAARACCTAPAWVDIALQIEIREENPTAHPRVTKRRKRVAFLIRSECRKLVSFRARARICS